jgi:hypothetical protein
MMKIAHIVCFWLIIGLPTTLTAQTWEKVGNGVSFGSVRALYYDQLTDRLIIAGSFRYAYTDTDTLEVNAIAAWDGTQWHAFPPGDTLCQGVCALPPTSIARVGDSLAIAGIFNTFGGAADTRYSAVWDGMVWASFANTENAIYLQTLNNDVYAIGNYDTIGNVYAPRIAKWMGNTWAPFTTEDYTDAPTGVLAWFNNQLVVGGNFNYNGIIDIALWNGTMWVDLGNPVIGGIAYVNDIITYKNLLFAGGYFLKSSGSVGNWLIYYDGTTWQEFPPSLVTFVGTTWDFEIIDNELYIAGAYMIPGDPNVYGFAKFNGQEFCVFGGADNHTLKMAEYDNYLYVRTTQVFNNDTMNFIARMALPVVPDTCIYMPLGMDAPATAHLNIYPNPTTGEATIEFEAARFGNATLMVLDLSGRLHEQKLVQLQPGLNRIVVNTVMLAAGTYLLRLEVDGTAYTSRLVKMDGQ